MTKQTPPALLAGVTALLAMTLFAASTAAQAPQGPPPAGAPRPPMKFPEPTNLKVLPKNLTAEQVHEIMHKWEADLGTNCGHCHAEDPKNIGPNGRPRLNFADDSKKEKQAARMMFKMVEEINTNYVSMIDNSGAPVTCGTCHRGKPSPEPFVAPPEHDHDHPAPGAPQGEKPPQPH